MATGRRTRTVVTGAGGMLGRAVVERFASRHEVVPQRRADCDLADLRATVRWIGAQRPQIIVHGAAWTDVDGCEGDPERAFRDNAWATRNVALAAQLAGAAVCYVSTDYVFDGTKPSPYVEDDAPAPANVYGASKRAGELHVLRHAPRAWVARTSWLFGPGGRNFVATMAELLRRREAVRVVDDQVGSPTSTADLAAALLELVERAPAGLYHVTNSGTCTWYELACAIGARLGTTCRIQPCRSEEFPRPARRPHNSVLEPVHWRAAGLPPLRPWGTALDEYLHQLEREA
jgi:dTDP-4-dehydrorhamnose reductase